MILNDLFHSNQELLEATVYVIAPSDAKVISAPQLGLPVPVTYK